MKAAIVGPGRVSTEHIKAYLYSGVDVVAVCGRTKESAQQKINELGIGARAYDNLDLMLDRENVEIISICSPPELHKDHTIKAASRGINTAIEKPVALNPEDLNNMYEAVHRAGVKTMVGFVLRWNELMQNIKHNYLQNIGKLLYLETDYWNGPSHEKEPRIITNRTPITTFLSGGCHAVDMARFMADSDIISVMAATPHFEESKLQRTSTALVTFANGTTGKISATSEVFMPYIFNISLFGSDGAILLNKFYSKNSLYCKFMRGYRPTSGTFEPIPGTIPNRSEVWHHPFKNMLQEFVECIISNKETSCSLKDVINTHLVCFAAEESAKRGGEKICIV